MTCDQYGLSNFPPELLAEFLAVCEENNFTKPSVYQGLYNLLSRQSEQSLGVVLGASKVPQIVRNASDVSKGPLPVEVVHKIDTPWEKIRS